MNQAQRDILISNRVELVENLDMTGGLFTHLLARQILTQRKVNEFKLQRSPEAQAEELLSFLPKKDCFSAFCDALRADCQPDIVDKYLTLPTKKADHKETASQPSTDSQDLTTSTSLQRQEGMSPDLLERETPDSAISPQKRPIVYAHHPSSPSPTILCIKDSDQNNVYIKYDNVPSPLKRQKKTMNPHVVGAVMPYNVEDTRYAMKHFVSNEDEVVDSGSKSLLLPHKSLSRDPQVVVLENRQSVLENSDSSDVSRNTAGFPRQPAEKPYENSSVMHSHSSVPSEKSTSFSPLNLKDSSNENNSVHDLLSHLSGGNSQSVFQTLLKNRKAAELSPIKNPQYFSDDSLQSNFKFMDPHTYLNHTGVLTTMKGVAYAENRSRAYESSGQCKGDSLDAMAPIQNQYGVLHPDSSVAEQFNSRDFEEHPELEIDLPDGCVNVKVEHSTRQFFLSNFKKSYPMRQIPRGLALVINVDEVEGKPPRKGTNFDRDNLCNLLTQLHFNIVVYNDNDGLSAQEMVDKLKAFAKLKDHHNYDACFICLLSHGEEGYIFGTDGKRIPLKEIFMLFDNTNCQGLIGKPKVFIIQACRGGTLDKGVRMDETDGGSIPTKTPVNQQLPCMSDMLICYPTLMGYYAWRNRARGSWYIEAIVQVFMRYAKCEDICAMLNRVNQVVSRKVSECNQKEMNQMSQMSEYKSTLRQPHLYLFPGIGCSGL